MRLNWIGLTPQLFRTKNIIVSQDPRSSRVIAHGHLQRGLNIACWLDFSSLCLLSRGSGKADSIQTPAVSWVFEALLLAQQTYITTNASISKDTKILQRHTRIQFFDKHVDAYKAGKRFQAALARFSHVHANRRKALCIRWSYGHWRWHIHRRIVLLQ